jgi:hypothetical protein
MITQRKLKKHFIRPQQYYNRKPVEFVPALTQLKYVKEDNSYIPRFSVNQRYHQIFSKYPVNKQLPYNSNMIVDAIQYGMILLVQYRGAADDFAQGHSRVIYPMVLGKSSQQKELLRVYHLKGWSVSKRGNIEKEWRLFRTDRILSIAFTGSFYRLSPDGYNMRDRSMKGGITRAADFNEIRKNQSRLLQSDVIQSREDTEFDKISSIVIDDTNTTIDLRNPFDNPNIHKEDVDYIRISFLKGLQNNERIAILGGLGKRGNRVKVYSQGNYKGLYVVERSVMGPMLGNRSLQNVGGTSEMPMFIFLNKK